MSVAPVQDAGPVEGNFINYIIRAGSLIAARTRRGAGNAVFMHPDTLYSMLRVRTISKAFSIVEPSYVGRWYHSMILNGTMRVYISDHMLRSTATVIYLGDQEFDRPAYLFNDHGQLRVKLIPPSATALGTVTDYVERIAATIPIKLKLITPRHRPR